jgi:hypothetical protein
MRMSSPDVRTRLQEANPVPTGESSHLSPQDARLLTEILATPRHRARRRLGRLLVPALAAAALIALVAVVLTNSGGSQPSDEVEATAPPPGASVPSGAVVHVVTREYSHRTSASGPQLVYGKRIEGWAQPSTGRARIVELRNDGTITYEIAVDRHGVTTVWFPGRVPERHRSPSEARSTRRLVTDRIDARVAEVYPGSPAVAPSDRQVRTVRTTYHGRPAVERDVIATVHLLDPANVREFQFARTFRDPRTGAPLGFEFGDGDPRRGHVTVSAGERVLVREVLSGPSAVRALNWVHVG